MGEFLSTPIKEKVSEDNEDQFVRKKTYFKLKFKFLIDKIWSMWNARLEKKNGRFSYF